MNPVIFTAFNHLIDPKFHLHQARVVERFSMGIPFIPMQYNFTMATLGHGDVLNRAINELFYYKGYDCILILDIDAVPTSIEATLTTFDLAYNGKLVGNIQRANHLNNNQHVYVAPSYMCFTRDTFENAGYPNLSETNKYDVGETFTVNCERFNIPTIKFMPLHSDAPVNENGDMWDLADGMPKYGHSTTFEYQGKPISYHLFNSFQDKYSQYFYNKCEELLK